MLEPFLFVLVRSPLQGLQYAYRISEQPDPLFKEGLYLSSPEFLTELEKKDQLSLKEREKMDRSMAKYWVRSCMRCTPYGTFAGFFEAAITDDPTRLIINESNTHTRHTRIDMSYIEKIVHGVMKLPEVNQHVLYYPNNSLYEIGDSYRYAEYTVKQEMRKYHLSAVAKSDYLQLVLERAARGATMEELVNILVENELADREESLGYIKELYESQLLVASLDPSITGIDPLQQVIQQLEHIESVQSLVNDLKQIQECLQKKGIGTEYYKEITERLEKLGLGITIGKNVFQTDLRLSTQSPTVNKETIRKIGAQAEELLVLARVDRNRDLEDFKTKFQNKYEENEIPLAIALDADLGIGYAGFHDENAGASDFVDDFGGIEARMQEGEFDQLKRYVIQKYDDYLRAGNDVLEIKEEELAGFKKNAEQLRYPASIFLQGHLLKKEGATGNDDARFAISSFFGPSAANLLGRFAYASKSLEDGIKEILRVEETENPDAIYAEIAHLPQARIGNILLRPVLRQYEIPYVGKSGLPEEQHIDLNDLFVSVRSNAIILRSRKHNKQVIPRLTTAHNYSTRSLPFYKFLCDLQRQHLAMPRVWDWGSLGILKRLPRVIYKDLILQKAQWKLDKKDIGKLPQKKEEYPSFAASLRKTTGMPRLVLFVQFDNELLIDFEQERGVDLFLHYINKYESVQIEEFLFSENSCIVQNTAGDGFTNELIIPLNRIQKTEQQLRHYHIEKQNRLSNVQRKFQLNGEWIYFKIYCGTKTTDKLLTQHLLPYVRQGLDNKLFERFFFIRYKDDFSHFRVRFYNEDVKKQPRVMTSFLPVFQEYLDKGIINKITTDAYNREIERYGDDLIEEAETLFFNDSLCTLQVLDLLEDDERLLYRFFLAMRGIDMLLDDFNLTPLEKRELMGQLAGNFHAEFGGLDALSKLLNNKYRSYQKNAFSFLDSNQDEANGIEEAIEFFRQRSASNEPVAKSILSKLNEERGERLFRLLGSYIHMFMNRFFVAQQRKYELVMYHFLERYYISRLAILKGKEKKGTDKVKQESVAR